MSLLMWIYRFRFFTWFLSKEKSLKVGQQLAEEKIRFPSSWRNHEVEVYKIDDDYPYQLRLLGNYVDTDQTAQSVMASLLIKIKKARFASNCHRIKTEVVWGKDNFLKEESLGDVNNVTISLSFDAYDKPTTRDKHRQTSHKIDAKMEGQELRISASGEYEALIPRLVEAINPSSATVSFSQTDANQLIKKASRLEQSEVAVEAVLKPKKTMSLGFFTGGIVSDEVEVITTTLPVEQLKLYEAALGKSIGVRSKRGETGLLSLAKQYTSTEESLKDLQTIVSIMENFKTSTILGTPLLTMEEAKEILEEEIALLALSFSPSRKVGTRAYPFGVMFGGTIRSDILHRLATEHFDDDVMQSYREMDAPSFLVFVQNRGYIHDEEMMCDDNDIWREQKASYLAQFFQQSYAKDPHRSIENFRRFFTNRRPLFYICGNAEIDASKASHMALPARAELNKVALKEPIWSHSHNEIIFGRGLPFRNKEIDFWVRLTPKNSCPLLGLQQYLCEAVGITCR